MITNQNNKYIKNFTEFSEISRENQRAYFLHGDEFWRHVKPTI